MLKLSVGLALVAGLWIALFLSVLVYVTASANELAMAKCQSKLSYDVCFDTLN